MVMQQSMYLMQPMQLPERVVWLDVARGASIVLVVFFHCSIRLEQGGLLHSLYWEVSNLAGPVRMPLFFGVAGLLAPRLLSADLPSLLRKRTGLLWYLYGLWLAIHMTYFTLAGDGRTWLSWLSYIWSPHPVLWFIWALGFYFLVARLTPLWARPVVITLAIVASAATEANLIELATLPLDKTATYLAYFLGAAWYARGIIAGVRRPLSYVLAGGAGYLVLFVLLRSRPELHVARPLLSILGLLTGVSLSILVSRVALLRKPLAYLGQKTLPIYVAHSLFIDLAVRSLAPVASATPFVLIWAAPAVALLAIAASLVLQALALRLGGYWLYALPLRMQFIAKYP